MRSTAAFLLTTILATGSSACTSGSDSGVAPPTVSTTLPAGTIDVTLRFPDHGERLLVGPASGTVRTDDGTMVVSFAFDSAWKLGDNGSFRLPDNAPPEQTGAPSEIVVTLPEDGIYSFELDDYAVSGAPCGTCEVGWSGAIVEADIADGSIVDLGSGELIWES